MRRWRVIRPIILAINSIPTRNMLTENWPVAYPSGATKSGIGPILMIERTDVSHDAEIDMSVLGDLVVADQVSALAAYLPDLAPDDRDRVDGYVARASAEATLRAYQSDWRLFCAWCEESGYRSLPATPAIVAAFLTLLAERGVCATDAASGAGRARGFGEAARAFNDRSTAIGNRLCAPRSGVRSADATARRRAAGKSHACHPPRQARRSVG